MMRDCQYTIQCDCGLGDLHKSQTISAFTPTKKIAGLVSYKQPFTAHAGIVRRVPLCFVKFIIHS